MPKDFFAFKQFAVKQDRASFKVGTDGCLLGAWVDLTAADRVLDIGTGTGVIALMLAQRSKAFIDAIDIDLDNVLQAQENVEASPWKNRVQATHSSLQDWSNHSPKTYDHFVSNPPFFLSSTLNLEQRKQQSRHATRLSFEDIFSGARKLGSPSSKLSLVIPTDRLDDLSALAERSDWHEHRRCFIHPTRDKEANRALITYCQIQAENSSRESLILYDDHRDYTSEARALLAPYYLYL